MYFFEKNTLFLAISWSKWRIPPIYPPCYLSLFFPEGKKASAEEKKKKSFLKPASGGGGNACTKKQEQQKRLFRFFIREKGRHDFDRSSWTWKGSLGRKNLFWSDAQSHCYSGVGREVLGGFDKLLFPFFFGNTVSGWIFCAAKSHKKENVIFLSFVQKPHLCCGTSQKCTTILMFSKVIFS